MEELYVRLFEVLVKRLECLLFEIHTEPLYVLILKIINMNTSMLNSNSEKFSVNIVILFNNGLFNKQAFLWYHLSLCLDELATKASN